MIKGSLSTASDPSLAIIVSEFNRSVTSALLEGALTRARELGLTDENLLVIEVPGAVEIPLVAKRLARSEKYDAIIALGAVIRGETAHFDYVCQQVSDGCSRVMLKYDCPVIFGVLTTETVEQAKARAGGAHSDKGKDSIDCALTMLSVFEQLESHLYE